MDSRAAPWRPFEGLCSIQVLLEDCRSEAPGTVLLESLLWLTREYRDFFAALAVQGGWNLAQLCHLSAVGTEAFMPSLSFSSVE